MDERRLKETLEKAFPDTPAEFHFRLAQTAERVEKEKKTMKRKMFLQIALVCLLILSMTGGALAAMTHYGVLNFNSGWEEEHYFTLPGAENMIHYDLAEVKTGNLTWKVEEAAYDGRVLRVLYSVRDRTADAPLTGQDPTEAYSGLCSRNGIYLKLYGNGEIVVNGQPVNIESMDFRHGEENGEIECWFDCRMEGYQGIKLLPEGNITVSMPFAFHQEEDKAAAEAEALTFSMDVGDAASRYALALPAPYVLNDSAVLTFTDLHFSPVTVFIDAAISFPENWGQKLPDESEYEDMALYMKDLDAFFRSIPEYEALFDMRLENADGEILGESRDGFVGHNVDDAGVFSLVFRYENTPSDKYTDVNYLCFGEWKVPIPMEYKAE